MAYRIPYMAELVFVLVGAYLVALPRIARKAGPLPAAASQSPATATAPEAGLDAYTPSEAPPDAPLPPNAVLLQIRKTAGGVEYVLDKNPPCRDLETLGQQLAALAKAEPEASVRVKSPPRLAWGAVVDVCRLVRQKGLALEKPVAGAER